MRVPVIELIEPKQVILCQRPTCREPMPWTGPGPIHNLIEHIATVHYRWEPLVHRAHRVRFP